MTLPTATINKKVCKVASIDFEHEEAELIYWDKSENREYYLKVKLSEIAFNFPVIFALPEA